MGGTRQGELEGREKRVEMLASVATQDAVSDCTVCTESGFPYNIFPSKQRFKCLTTSVFLTVDAAETTEVEAWEETSVRSRETSPYTSVDCIEKGSMLD